MGFQIRSSWIARTFALLFGRNSSPRLRGCMMWTSHLVYHWHCNLKQTRISDHEYLYIDIGFQIITCPKPSFSLCKRQRPKTVIIITSSGNPCSHHGMVLVWCLLQQMVRTLICVLFLCIAVCCNVQYFALCSWSSSFQSIITRFLSHHHHWSSFLCRLVSCVVYLVYS